MGAIWWEGQQETVIGINVNQYESAITKPLKCQCCQVVEHPCNSSSEEAKAGGLPQV